MRALVNAAARPEAVAAPRRRRTLRSTPSLPGYRPTPVHELASIADELGLAAVGVKDESDRLGLPAFKVLGASWAVERLLAARPEIHTLVAASAGNHGRAVAHVAALRSLHCRVFLPARAAEPRRVAIAGEGAEVVIVDGTYEDAVAAASLAGTAEGVAEIADVGTSDTARWVIDGYATLFAELGDQGTFDVLLVPIGVGSLGAAAARFAAQAGITLIGVEPVTAACLTASLAAGAPASVPTPGHDDGGPRLRRGLRHGVADAARRRSRHRDRDGRRGRGRRPRARGPPASRSASRAPRRSRHSGRSSPTPSATRSGSPPGWAPTAASLLVATEGPTGVAPAPSREAAGRARVSGRRARARRGSRAASRRRTARGCRPRRGGA